jgi:antitoxin ParD1/3/4
MASSVNTVQKEAIAMPTRNVVLTDYQNSLVERLVRSGRYQNPVLREGLRLIEREDAKNRARTEALRDAAWVGIDDVTAGRIRGFGSAEELCQHFDAIASSAIASVHPEDSEP